MSTYYELDPLQPKTPPILELNDPYNSREGIRRTDSPVHFRSGTYDTRTNTNFEPDKPVRPANIRRYSGEWWSYRWNREVVKGFLPRLIYVLLGFAIMGVWIGVMFDFAARLTKHEHRIEVVDVSKLSGLQNSNLTDLIYLQGTLRTFDTDAGSLTIQWAAVTPQENQTFIPIVMNATYGWPIGLYRDIIAIYDDNTTQLLDDGTTYLKLDNLTAPLLGTLGVHAWDGVDTDIDMLAADPADVWKEPLFGYPWDQWEGSIVLTLTDLEAITLFNQTGLVAGTPDGISVTGSILNWDIKGTSQLSSDCTTDISVTDVSCFLTITLSAQRPGIVRFCVIAVIIVNWLSTIAIFLVTGEAVLLRRTHILSGTDILGVTFSALFALPSVRSLLPGAPSQFGAVIDLIGILPNVIIISLCTTVFAVAKINARIKESMEADGKRSE